MFVPPPEVLPRILATIQHVGGRSLRCRGALLMGAEQHLQQSSSCLGRQSGRSGRQLDVDVSCFVVNGGGRVRRAGATTSRAAAMGVVHEGTRRSPAPVPHSYRGLRRPKLDKVSYATTWAYAGTAFRLGQRRGVETTLVPTHALRGPRQQQVLNETVHRNGLR